MDRTQIVGKILSYRTQLLYDKFTIKNSNNELVSDLNGRFERLPVWTRHKS